MNDKETPENTENTENTGNTGSRAEKDREAQVSSENAKRKRLEPLTISRLLEIILKSPTAIKDHVREGTYGDVSRHLVVIYSVCMAAYGLIVGSFSGGDQWWAAPAKAVVGFLVTALICLPSLYIFSCLAGAEVRIGDSAIVLLAGITLTAIILIGFAPVAWVFSQSTNSLAFMGFLHLVFWLICLLFGMSLITRLLRMWRVKNLFFVYTWVCIFMITTLQMMTAVRPLLGTSPDFLPKEKKFFLIHWGEVIQKEVEDSPNKNWRNVD